LKLLKGNDMESVITRSNSLRRLEAGRDARWCTPRSARSPRRTEVLCCVVCQHQLGAAEKGGRKVGCTFGCNCYSLLLHTPARIEEGKHVPRRGSGRTRVAEIVRLLAGCSLELFGKVHAISVFGMLTKWLHITRLETRTKETIMFASIWVENPRAQ
jgi:hypothetical protein